MKGFWLGADVTLRLATRLLDEFSIEFYGAKVHALTDPALKDRVKILRAHGAKHIWNDIKLHETPDMAARRADTIQKCGVNFITVHASGGAAMMEAVVKTGIGVYTVFHLSTMSPKEFDRYYKPGAIKNMIEDAVTAGVHGFICPPTQVRMLRETLQKYDRHFDIISPGTRFVNGVTNDQYHVETPGATARDGADYLVIGRMLTEAKNKHRTMDQLNMEIRQAMAR